MMPLNENKRMEMAKQIARAALCMDDLSSNTATITTELLEEAKAHIEALHNAVETLADERSVEIYGAEE